MCIKQRQEIKPLIYSQLNLTCLLGFNGAAFTVECKKNSPFLLVNAVHVV